jgi:hypothetical protein
VVVYLFLVKTMCAGKRSIFDGIARKDVIISDTHKERIFYKLAWFDNAMIDSNLRGAICGFTTPIIEKRHLTT